MRILAATFLIVALGAGAASAAVPASWFRAVNGMWVQPETPRKFYVGRGTRGGDDYFWCAAGDYVMRNLRLPGSTPIFRLSPPPRRAGQGVWFSLDPEGASARTGVTTLLSSGPANSVSANAAKSFCQPRFRR